jgi:undecaprenyl-diphosphatase
VNLFQAIILGLVQGATEFVPISSSAHLVLIPALLGWNTPSFEFDVAVHFGTALAVIAYFWADWVKLARAGFTWLRTRDSSDPDFRLLLFIVLGNIPAVILGLAFRHAFEEMFHDPMLAAWTLFLNAGILVIGERLGKQERGLEQINLIDAVTVGIAQAIAIIPGISRSGSTIAVGHIRNLTREAAARYSFLMVTPLLIAGGLVQLLELTGKNITGSQWLILGVGFLVALISGYTVIHWLLRFLRTRPMTVFAIYCAIFAIACLIIFTVRGG